MGEWAPNHEAQGFEDKVNAAVVHRKRMFLFGEICPTWRYWPRRRHQRGRLVDQGPGARGTAAPRRAKQAVEPQPIQRAAQQCAGVIGQKSAEAVVAGNERRRAEHESTRRSGESLAHGVEPGWGSRATA